MNHFSVHGIRTRIISPGDDIAGLVIEAAENTPCGPIREGDVIVLAESAVATAEGRIVALESVVPSEKAVSLAEKYEMDPREVEIVLAESDEVVGGIPGFLLSMKDGTLLPNAGVDASNAPPGSVVLLPRDPDASADAFRKRVETCCDARVGVIIADSRTHAMRSGCSGVAIGCAGIESVIDERGRADLFGRPLEVTKRAIADNIASAAEIVMGEADERTPAAIVRGLGIPITADVGIESIDAEECLFMGLLKHRIQD